MKKLLTLGILFMPLLANAKMLEKDYVQKHCSGIVEYKNPDNTRIDCLTSEEAIEFDYARKWSECVGQALYYGKLTGKTPVCALILDKDENRFLERAKALKNTNPSELEIIIIEKEGK